MPRYQSMVLLLSMCCDMVWCDVLGVELIGVCLIQLGPWEASRFDLNSNWPFRFDSKVMGRIKKFQISRACPLLVVVKRLKPLRALSGTVYRLASSMSGHMPVLFNMFVDWNEESVVPHISFVSFVICRPALLQCKNWIDGIETATVGPSWNLLSSIYGRFEIRFEFES